MIDNLIEAAKSEINRTKERIAELEQLDWIGKKEGWPIPCCHWEKRGGYSYLVLIFWVDGRHIRRWIGREPERVSWVLRSVTLHREYELQVKRLELMEICLRETENAVYLAGMKLKSVTVSASRAV